MIELAAQLASACHPAIDGGAPRAGYAPGQRGKRLLAATAGTSAGKPGGLAGGLAAGPLVPIVVAVIPVPSAIVPFTVAVPVMVVVSAATISVPIAVVEAITVVTRRHPSGSR